MPVERRKSINQDLLIQELREEYIAGENSGNAEPRIIIEENSHGQWHITVIWRRWEEFPYLRDRGDLIMEALDHDSAMSPDEIVKISIVAGYTPLEWKALGKT